MVPSLIMNIVRDGLKAALDAAAKGYTCIPCRPGTKVPLVKWKRYQATCATLEDYRTWFENTRNNIAIITAGMVVFDCDDPANADAVLKNCGETPHRLRTP